MIADTPFLADLARAADRVIPQEGDAQVIIPSMVYPSVPAMSGHSVSNASTDRANTSKIFENTLNLTNAAGGNQNLIVLPKGLYTLIADVSVRFNFTSAIANGIVIGLSYQGFQINLLTFLTQVGSFRGTYNGQLLLFSDATLVMEYAATNAVASDSIQSLFSGNVIRHI